jgi:hypothetical protein
MKKNYHVNYHKNTFYYADEGMTILHRLDGPAVEHADGFKSWWVEGRRHRLDGPAIECADGYKAWWVEGKRLTEAEFNMLHELKEITLEQIAEKFGIPVEKIRIKL